MTDRSAGGLVGDVPYPYSFIRELAPAWLNFVATLSGFAAPSRGDNFAWCELGCGQGLTAAILAATHPGAEFHGIDAMPAHIDHARRLCANAGIRNLMLHDLDFAAASETELASFDYIVAHGVYSWIAPRFRKDICRFIDRQLKPGGLVYISYNALPGWASDGPFQYLLREIARSCKGDSKDKFLAALSRVQAYTAAGARALASSFMATADWEQLRKTRSAAYFAHEYLPSAWQPLYVTEVRAQMADIGLVPAGSATVGDNFDNFVLRAGERKALAGVADPNQRELIRDFFLNTRFRRDVFVRRARRIGDTERAALLAEATFDLQRPVELINFDMSTEAGRVQFDNRAARSIVAALADGPKRLADIAVEGMSRADLLANALALFAAQEIRPVSAGWVEVGKLNEAILGRVDGGESLPYIAVPCGTAFGAASALVSARREGLAPPDELLPWSKFLRRYGI
jgi:SAM-dependent methyltransferase